MSETFKELEYHRDTLREFEGECNVGTVDFSKVKFHCTDNSMWLELRDGTFPRTELHFRINPHDNKDKDAIHAHKQLCKAVKVPYKFFTDNRPTSRESFVKDWVSALIPEASDSMYKVKVRECREITIIRAILPTDIIEYPNYRVLDSIMRDGQDIGMKLKSIIGETRDASEMELAVSFGEPVDVNGELFHLGLVCNFSDVSTSNIRVHAFLFPENGGGSFPITFGFAPLLDLPYNAMSPQDMDKVLAGIPLSLLALRPEIVSKAVAVASLPYSNPEDALEVVSGGIKSSAVIKKMRREFLRDGAADTYTSAWDFAKGLSSLAMSYDGDTRLMVELAASAFLGLNLPPMDSEDLKK